LAKEKLLKEEKSKKEEVASHVVALAEKLVLLQSEHAQLEKEEHSFSAIAGSIMSKIDEILI
jgi:hypothetical protein